MKEGKEIMDLFPHKKIRPIQKEFLEDGLKAIKNNKFLLAHAPTGIGKTAAALTAALTARKKEKVLFLTPRKSQQEIVLKTLELINKKGYEYRAIGFMSKRDLCLQLKKDGDIYESCSVLVKNRECPFYENVKLEREKNILRSRDLISIGKEKNMCPYYYGLKFMEKAEVIVMDYNYIFSPFIKNIIYNRIGNDNILVIDEAHNLGDRVREFNSSTLSYRTINQAIKEVKKYGDKDVEGYIIELATVLLDLTTKLERNGKEEAYLPIEELPLIDLKIYEKMMRIGEETILKGKTSYVSKIAKFMIEWKDEDGFITIIDQKGIRKICMDPSIYTREVWANSKGILMSGTLKPLIMYKELLGIDNCEMKEYKNPYEKNKKQFVFSEVTSLYKRRIDEYEKIARNISIIGRSIDKGGVLVFFPSYSFMEEIYKRMDKGLEIIKEAPEKKLKKIESFEKKAKKDRTLLFGVIGGSFSEGIDIDHSILKIVIIVGVPLEPPNLEVKARIKYYDYKFGNGQKYAYILPAIRKALQASGRVVRNEKDKGIVIFMDYRYKDIYKKWLNYEEKDINGIIKEIKQFLEN